MEGQYISLLGTHDSSGYTSLLSTNIGGESAGTVAGIFFGGNSNIAYMGGETAGSVASSSFSTSCSTSSSGSFSAVA